MLLRKTKDGEGDPSCAVPYAEHDGGSMAIPVSADCTTTETARQAIRLDGE